MQLHVEIEREQDGRWLAEVLELPGVMVYADSQQDALRKVQALALQVLADKLQHGELEPEENFSFEQVQAA